MKFGKDKRWAGRLAAVALAAVLLAGCGLVPGDASASGTSDEELKEAADSSSAAESVRSSEVSGSEGAAVSSSSSAVFENVESSSDVQSESASELSPVTVVDGADNTNGYLIVLDPGHQAPDVDISGTEPIGPGSSEMKDKASGGTSGVSTGVGEYELNLAIALQLRDALMNEGYDVLLTREDNETAISNIERAEVANSAGADAFIRIHANGSEDSSAHGALAMVGSASNPYVGSLYSQSSALAEDILNFYCAETGMTNQGVVTADNMTGINWSKVPVTILEMGFMTNPTDDENMEDPDYQIKMVNGIMKGINEYFGLN